MKYNRKFIKRFLEIEIFNPSIDPLNHLLVVRLIVFKVFIIDWWFNKEQNKFIN